MGQPTSGYKILSVIPSISFVTWPSSVTTFWPLALITFLAQSQAEAGVLASKNLVLKSILP